MTHAAGAGACGDGEGATVVVLCGGGSVRFGADKLGADLGGVPVLDRTISGMPPAWPLVCAGPERPTSRKVRWVGEDPPDGGPLAGVAAALPLVRTAVTVVVAGDMPAAGGVVAALVLALVAAGPEVAAVTATDGEGYRNPLLAAYRTVALRAALRDGGRDRAARTLLRDLPHVPLRVDDLAAADVDTPAQLEALRRRLEP